MIAFTLLYALFFPPLDQRAMAASMLDHVIDMEVERQINQTQGIIP